MERNKGRSGQGSVRRAVRIIAAVVNPEGRDPGSETVTLVNTGRSAATLERWSINDKNGRAHLITGVTLVAGAFHTLELKGNTAQLSNKGGEIVLKDDREALVHRVTYSKAQARSQGVTILF